MRLLSIGLTAALIVAGTAVPASAAERTSILSVGLLAGADRAAIAASLGDTAVIRPVLGMEAITAEVAEDSRDRIASRIRTLPGVRYVEFNSLLNADSSVELVEPFTDPEIAQAWTWTRGGTDVTVAVVDTGVTPTAGLSAERLTQGYDFVDGDTDASDDTGHGTMIAGVIAADHPDGTTPDGVCPKCRIMPIRVMKGGDIFKAGEGRAADVAAGIVWAVDHGAQVVNLGLTGYTADVILRDAVEYADQHGVLVVGTAGGWEYPARFGPVLAVGRAGTKADETKSWIEVAAPGVTEVFDHLGTRKAFTSASVSTAIVSGVAALGFATKPSATPGELRELIETGADDYQGRDTYQPRVVNAAQLLSSLGAVDTVPPVVVETGLTEGQLLPGHSVQVTPRATDDHGVERIEYLVDGEVHGTARRSPWKTSFFASFHENGPMTVVVRAYDYSGNVHEKTTNIEVDSVAPKGTFVTPAVGGVLPAGEIDVIVDGPDAERVDLGTDDTPFRRIEGTTRWQRKVTPYSDGTISVRLRDKAGNSGHLSGRWSVDREPPFVGEITPKAGALVRGTFTSALSGVYDEVGVAKVELWANGKYVGADITAPYSLAVKTGTSNGNIRLLWKATDRFGLSRTLPERVVVADNKAPTVWITSAPKNKSKVKGTVKVTAKAVDTHGVARVELLVNGKVVAKDSTAAYVLKFNANKQKKTMKVQVRAYDRLGNVKYTSSRTWYRK